MRYFIKCAYNGTNYCGWQVQPAAESVQGVIQAAMSTILGSEVEIVGCGRTDAGVHAREYYFHFDWEKELPQGFLRRLNRFLPADVAIYEIIMVFAEAHARFDAYYREYEYHISLQKDPFARQFAWQYGQVEKLSLEKLNEMAAILLSYKAFAPFCKTHSDAKTMECELTRCEWVMAYAENRLVLRIGANRFLRGMVRLIVGMCVNVALDKIAIDDVRKALDHQTMLPKSYSAPPEGLFLTAVRYPEGLLISPKTVHNT